MAGQTANKTLSFFDLYNRFINDSRRGKRLQPNGKKLSEGTVDNYAYTLALLQKFCVEKQFELRMRPMRKLNSRDVEVEKNYWRKFYKKFTDWLYLDKVFLITM